MAMISTLRAKAVKDICGFGSVAMIDYLERSGVFVPQVRRRRKRGVPREYTFRDVLILKTLATLLEHGATVAALKDVLGQLQNYRWKAETAVLEHSGGAIRHLIFSGGRFHFSANRDQLVDLTYNGQMSFAFVLDLDKLHSIVQAEWAQMRIGLDY